MPELTEKDIAGMKLDKLSPAMEMTVIISDTKYGLIDVIGYYDRINNKFEVHEIKSETFTKEFIEREKVRSFIQDNYEDKLVEACL